MKASKVKHKVSQLQRMYKGKKLSFDLAIQRKGNIWDVKRQSMFIHSVLAGYPIPNLFATKDENVFYLLDGKQRLSSIFAFLNDEFALSFAQTPKPSVDGIDVEGLTFKQLSDEFQQRIKEYQFEIDVVDEISQSEIEDIFCRLNNGVPLRPIETTRALLGKSALEFVENLAKVPFFTDKINLSKAARNHFVDQELVLQILALLNDPLTGFSKKEMKDFVQKLRDDHQRDRFKSQFNNVCFYLNEAFPSEKEKLLRKVHIPMLFKLTLDMQHRGIEIPAETFGEWARGFLEAPPESYVEACSSGSAKKENVQKRLRIMTEEFEKHFNVKVRDEVPNANDEVAASVETVEEQGE
ncbi:DUF262 domain-containing protein [Alicyclobacillus tolerans]|uniref:GmrSD restriction endonucleases N-terminal domain-containing protein n=1 Tax=Alicyclobacillus tolerans TaxID=90970 RepID=A0A1M6TMZ5_9BACL|nr:DUF262 domain-containing protein [Alicyclobacillus montanus]SHK58283.1 Protein of unknown function DUF262 [Alicyclobacillus montanus]